MAFELVNRTYFFHGQRKVWIYAMCEESAFRIVFSCAMIKMVRDIYKSLQQGQRILDGTDRRPVFIAVAIVPMINSFLCHTVETGMMLFHYFVTDSVVSKCNDMEQAIENHVTVPVVTGVYLIASLSNCCAYLICFPKLRENPCFKCIFRGGQEE